MIVSENLDNVLTGKTPDQINTSFKKKYGIEMLPVTEIVEKFREYGISSSLSNQDVRIKPWSLLSGTTHGNMLNTIGTFLTKEEAEKAANSKGGFFSHNEIIRL